jgi:hypothetical protein
MTAKKERSRADKIAGVVIPLLFLVFVGPRYLEWLMGTGNVADQSDAPAPSVAVASDRAIEDEESLASSVLSAIDADLRAQDAASDFAYEGVRETGGDLYVETGMYPKQSNADAARGLCVAAAMALMDQGVEDAAVFVEASDGLYLAMTRGTAGYEGTFNGCRVGKLVQLETS